MKTLSQRFFLPLLACVILLGGCEDPAAIETYVISTKVPAEFLPKKQRMLGAMFPKGDKVWFFKVMGPEAAVSMIVDPFRSFVETIPFSDEGPLLSALPDGWRRAADKPMRFASISVETPEKQLDISISSLSLQEDWDQQVLANVNRWRGQLAIENSSEPLAGGEIFSVESSDGTGVWVDLTGEPSDAAASMAPPFASGTQRTPATTGSQSLPGNAVTSVAKNDDPRVQYSRPDGWRDGRASSMRLASFSVGPSDAEAEITIIVAGGDVRGNVARWMGQVMGSEVADEAVNQTIESAEQIQVDGRDAQRFYLVNEADSDSKAIDGTIVTLGPEQSVFIKMTGPSRTVESQRKQVSDFITSLSLDF